jgi:hypothetical protein
MSGIPSRTASRMKKMGTSVDAGLPTTCLIIFKSKRNVTSSLLVIA